MTTPRAVIASVVESVCRPGVERLTPVAGGGMNETYLVELTGGSTVVARVARHGVPWFTDEAHLTQLARAVGVPAAEVFGVEHLELDGDVVSVSVQQRLPGRPLDELVGELTGPALERLVVDAGELLARVHSLATDRGTVHRLGLPDEHGLARAAIAVRSIIGPTAAEVVDRSADHLRRHHDHAAPSALAHGDFMPKNLLVDEGAVVGVVDWEFAGPAPPAYDLARWEVSAGHPFDDRPDLLRRGYARTADPDSAAAGLVPAFSVAWALEKLAWRNPAAPDQVRRCVDVLTRHTAG